VLQGLQRTVRAGLPALLLVAACYLHEPLRAQDISGGAGEGVKRPAESSARRRPRATATAQPKAKRATRAAQPKVDLSKQVDSALELGNAARDNNPPRYADAERAYRLALELDPQESRAYVGLGNTFFDQRRYADAEAAFRRATELDPEDADAFVSLAYSSNAQERYEDAEKSAQRALALDRNNAAAHAALGWSNFKRRKYAEAEAAYRRAIALAPQSPELLSELSQVLIEQGRWRDTEPVLRQAVTLDPADALMMSDYGVVLHKLGQLDRAAETYAAVSKLDPKMSAAHSNLALVEYTRGDFTKAREEWETALRLNSTYALDRAGLLVLDRKFAEAGTEIEKYVQASGGTDEDGWLMLGDVRRMQGDDAGSRAAYVRAQQLAPDYAQHARPTVPAPVVAKATPTPEVKPSVENKTGTGPVVIRQPTETTAATTGGQPKALTPRYASSVRQLKATNLIRPTPSAGTVSVTSVANASVLIEPVAGGEALVSIVPSALTVVSFNQLRPGDYRVVVALDGYETMETQIFVTANKIAAIKMMLRKR